MEMDFFRETVFNFIWSVHSLEKFVAIFFISGLNVLDFDDCVADGDRRNHDLTMVL
jgi:hypothetical protein